MICKIHLLSCRAFRTEIIFLFAFWNRDGVRFFAVAPSIHDDVQNCAVFPSPKATTMDAVNRVTIPPVAPQVQAVPRTFLVFPLKPKPLQSQHPRETFWVQDSQSTSFFWSASRWAIY